MTEEQIIAYVDGELEPLAALRFERAMAADAALAEAVGRHRQLRETIGGRFAGVAAEPVPNRLRLLLDRDDTIMPFPVRPRPSFARPGGYVALAATLVAGLVFGQLLPRAAPGPISERSGRIVADGHLANALDGQLASAQAPDTPYRIGVSFRATDGRYCRSFEGAVGAGLGCHGRDGWTLEQFVAEAAAGRADYRQAASPSARILTAAQDMMAGDPLDAEAERRARDDGWVRSR